MNFLFQSDANLFLFINHLPHNFFLDDFFGLLSFVGEYGAIWFILSFFLSIKNLALKGNALRNYFPIEAKKLTAIWVTGLVSLALVFFLKEIFRRERPEFVLQNVILPFGPDASFSFPSGHALMSFTFAYLLTKYYPKSNHKTKLSEARSGKLEIGNGNGKTEMGIQSQKISFVEKLCLFQNPASHLPRLTSSLVFYLLAVFISFSRLYLGYHYPLDVVAGAIIGIVIAKIALKVLAIRK